MRWAQLERVRMHWAHCNSALGAA
ncbi:hypothetical protein A2U01_0099861, partial [Trifolium medium]|nr:hypothetical protein [Trifolium medium]